MPRVYGGWPGAVKLVSRFSGRSASVYRRSTGTPEIVVKRAWPEESRLMPVATPMGRSGDFLRAGSSVCFSHRSFSVDSFDLNGSVCDASGIEANPHRKLLSIGERNGLGNRRLFFC